MFDSIFASTTFSDGTLNLRRTERPRSGDDCVEFVRADKVPGHKCCFRGRLESERAEDQ